MAQDDDKADLEMLMARVALRNRKAFTELYRLTSPKLFGLLLRMLKNRSEAEDALQDVFIKVWQRAERFSAEAGKPQTWLAAIARNHAIDLMRAKKPGASVIDEAFDLASDTPDPEAEAVNRSEGDRIDRCMQTLEYDRAEAVKKAYVEGLSYQELADFYNIPLNTIRTWLRRSLLKLRECLGR
jgi:RNA polymerase sigma-70 factor (ECF subfamily)